MAHVESLKAVAQEHKSKMNFVWIDAIKFGDHAKALNLQEPQWPSFVIQDLNTQLKYPHDQSVSPTVERIAEMVSKFNAGELVPELKSMPIPATQDESVYTVVGKTFDEVVFDESKDVFIELYASWCGHCKRLKPTWDTLGDHFAAVKDSVTIAKMEAQENDLPPSAPFKVQGFPTLKFRPAGSKEFIDYDGDRSLESLIAFVEENAKNSLEAPAAAPVETVAEPEIATEATEKAEVHDEL